MLTHIKNNNKKLLVSIGGAAMTLGFLVMAAGASAASTVVVTPAHPQGWSTSDTRPGGAVNFVLDAAAPGGTGALELTTNASTTAKAQYMHAASTTLSSLTSLSYYTKQVSAPFPGAAASYQLPVFLNGTTGFSTLVFEPYQNPAQGPVVPGVWQKWDVANGLFWSTRTVTCSNGVIAGTPGGPASYTLAQVKAICPNATVIGFGVNIGSNNPSYVVRTDLFNFNGTVYDFEVTNVPTNKNQCKDGGYVNYTDAAGHSFTNQGQCVRFVENDKNNDGNNEQGDKDNDSGHHDNHDGEGQDD